jgi:2-C-methyl-D-erythritol 2,4-cyclodiphosphate synthase
MMRIGIGYDLHRLEPGRPLILGGTHIPHDRGLAGYSDADALCHAITDALLGALALGDIGTHFPDDDPQYRDADSTKLLAAAAAMVREAGYRVVNVDSVIIAQRPKLRPHAMAIRTRLAEVIGIPVENVSVKAKTNEGVGAEGREEAVSTQAVVLVERA